MDMRSSRVAAIALVFCPGAQIIAAQQPDSSTRATLAAVERAIRERAAADSFSGAVLVARHGEILLRRGYGLADREARRPIDADTKFNLGSIDKLITRIAIWQLVAAGKLQLDVPVGRYLPDYPNAAVRARVTARQLYQMSSGVGDFYNEEYLRRHADIRTVDDYLSLFAADTLQFEPGTARLYSNGGYIILGKLIERLTGKSYYDYVLDNITGPLGMKDTRHYLIDEPVPNRAVGYTQMRGPLARNTGSLAGRGSPAGGGYSTVGDFLKLDAALRAGTLIPGGFADSILTPGFRAGQGDPLVYGGGGPGTNTQYASFPDGYTIVVFANADPPTATRVAQDIAKALGKSLPGGARVLRRPGD
jgi:D-alanyl-D-alanine carboxypeptidase